MQQQMQFNRAGNGGGTSTNVEDINYQLNDLPMLLLLEDAEPPISLEEALFLVSGSPDKYTIFVFFVLANVLSMLGYLLFVVAIFLFQTPNVECYNSDLARYFRCSLATACSRDYIASYKLDTSHTITNFISQYELLCELQFLN